MFSGALDSASRSIDQMIDQACHRHKKKQSTNRLNSNGKFKDTINCLDQIFEDLQKECDGSLPVYIFFLNNLFSIIFY